MNHFIKAFDKVASISQQLTSSGEDYLKEYMRDLSKICQTPFSERLIQLFKLRWPFLLQLSFGLTTLLSVGKRTQARTPVTIQHALVKH
jgi:hypothetical protein